MASQIRGFTRGSFKVVNVHDTFSLSQGYIVPDNLNIRQPQDPRQINVHEPWELSYWSKKFGVTPDQLKQAVKAVGTQTEAVKRHLGK